MLGLESALDIGRNGHLCLVAGPLREGQQENLHTSLEPRIAPGEAFLGDFEDFPVVRALPEELEAGIRSEGMDQFCPTAEGPSFRFARFWSIIPENLEYFSEAE